MAQFPSHHFTVMFKVAACEASELADDVLSVCLFFFEGVSLSFAGKEE